MVATIEIATARSIDIIKMFMLNEDDFAFIYISVGIIDDFDHRSPYQ